MEKQFVPYELSVKLKELGFDESCFARFRKGQFQLNTLGKAIEHNSQQIVSGDVSAPLWQQVGSFLYICSNKKIDISINGSDTYEELCEKFEKAISKFRDLQNNKSKR